MLTVLVPEPLFGEFKTACRKEGKHVSQVVRWLVGDHLARMGDEEKHRAEMEIRVERLRSRIQDLRGSIHHLETYDEMLAKVGGDMGETSDAKLILEKMEPMVEKFLYVLTGRRV